MAIPTEPARWRRLQSTEARASRCAPASTPRYRLAENIGFATVVVAELELREIQGQIFLRDVMIGSDHAPLEQRPERIQVCGMDFATYIFALHVIHGFVRKFTI